MESRRLAVILVIARRFVSFSLFSFRLYSSFILPCSFFFLFFLFLYITMSSPLVFPSAYSPVEEILVMLGLDIIPGDERSNGFMEQITCIIFVLDPLGKMAGNSSDIRLWPRLDRIGEMRFLARGKSGRWYDGRNSRANTHSTVNP